MESKKYHRIVLKLSGEALAGKQGYGIDPETVETIAKQVVAVNQLGVQVASSSAAATSGEACPVRPKAWTRFGRLHGHAATVMNSLAFRMHGKERRRYPRPDGYQHAAGR